MDSINILGILLFGFLSVFALYYLYIVFCSSKYKIWKLRYKYSPSKYNQNLNVVVYSHNDAEAVVEILENLKKQEYPLEKIKINVILDNCTDNSSNLLEILGGAKIWRINTGEKPLGRNAAIEWFIDRALATENTNAYVFLDSKNKINPFLLNNINNAISEFPVVIGRAHKHSDNKFLAPILSLSEKLKYDILYKGRSMAGFSNLISTEIFAVRQSILERIRFMQVQDQNAEIIYSLLLAKSKVPMIYSDELNSFNRDTTTIKGLLFEKYAEVKDRFKVFKYCFKLLFRSSTIKSKELILSLVYPCDIAIFALLGMLLSISNIEWFALGYELPHYLLSFYIVTTAYTCILARLSFAEVLAWPVKMVTSPFIILGLQNSSISLTNIGIDLPEIKVPKIAMKSIDFSKFKWPTFDFKSPFAKGPKEYVSVFVTNGTNDIECKLEEIQENGLYQAALWFKNKKITTEKCLRATDAIRELSEKLLNRGFALKICQNCGYFEPDADGKHDLKRGKCLLAIVKHGKPEPYSTKIYNNCKFIIPQHARDYVRKQLENMKID